MSDTPPDPPADLPAAVVDVIEEWSPDELDALAHYAQALSEYRSGRRDEESDVNRDGDTGEKADTDQAEGVTADRPDDVPAKASTTIKEINGNRYYYWQWRDGDRIRSQYKGPAESASED